MTHRYGCARTNNTHTKESVKMTSLFASHRPDVPSPSEMWKMLTPATSWIEQIAGSNRYLTQFVNCSAWIIVLFRSKKRNSFSTCSTLFMVPSHKRWWNYEGMKPRSEYTYLKTHPCHDSAISTPNKQFNVRMCEETAWKGNDVSFTWVFLRSEFPPLLINTHCLKKSYF